MGRKGPFTLAANWSHLAQRVAARALGGIAIGKASGP
jgi:hypothetical protein